MIYRTTQMMMVIQVAMVQILLMSSLVKIQWDLLKKRKKQTQADADKFIINYIRSKSNHRPNEDGPKKLFLLSLLPDLEEMSTAQFRMFRHEVVNLIDRVLGGQPSLTSYNLTTNHQTIFQQQFDSSSFDSQSHTSENTTDFDQPNMLYQELQPFLLRKPEK